MIPLELVFDAAYYAKSSGMLDLDPIELLEHYKKHTSDSCSAPNDYFAQDNNFHLLLQKDPDSGKMLCVIPKLSIEGITKENIGLIVKYFKSGIDLEDIKKIFKKEPPDNLEKILGLYGGSSGTPYPIINELITVGLESQQAHMLQESTIFYYEKVLEKSTIPNFVLSILINYAAKYAEDDEHAIFISSVLNEKYTKYSRYTDIYRSLSNQFLGAIQKDRYFAKEVFEHFENIFTKNVENENARFFLAFGAKNRMYKPMQASLTCFKDFLPKAASIRYSTLFIDAISVAIESLLDEKEINISLIKEATLEVLKYGQVSLFAVNKLIHTYAERENIAESQLHYLETLAIFVENYDNLPKEALLILVRPILSLIDSIGDNDQQKDTIKNSIFLIKRLFQQHLSLPPDTLEHFLKFLSHKDYTIKRLTVDLFKTLSTKLKINQVAAEKIKAFEDAVKSSNLQNIRLEDFSKILSSKKIYLSSVANKELLIKVQYLVTLGWTKDSLLSLFKIITPENINEFIHAITKVFNYGISPQMIDKDGYTTADIFSQKASHKWSENIQNLLNYNYFSAVKDIPTLLEEIRQLNKDYPEIAKLAESIDGKEPYLLAQLNKIKFFNSKLYHNIFLEYESEPKFLMRNVLYIYRKNGDVFYKALTDEGVIDKPIDKTKISSESLANINQTLLTRRPLGLNETESLYAAAGYRKTWSDKEFSEWRKKITTVDDNNIAEVISVLGQALYLAVFDKKHFIRDVQIMAVLILFKGQSRLLQVGTGEGKTAINAIFSAIHILGGEQIDAMTSSSVLATRDANILKNFYAKLDMRSSHNIYSTKEGISKDCYDANIVFGDPLYSMGDRLTDIMSPIMKGRPFNILLLDEIDNMLLDQIMMKIQKSGNIPGFEYLKQALIYAVGHLNSLSQYSGCNEVGDCYYFYPENTEDSFAGNQTVNWVSQAIEVPYDEFIRTNLNSYLSNDLFAFDQDIGSRKVISPKHLEGFVKNSHIGRWTNSSITAAYSYRQGVEYVVSNVTVADSQNSQITSIVRSITPVDYKNTGVIQKSLRWSDALHQLIEILQSLQLSSESVISTFMAYVSYFLKYKGKIFGFTGTPGEEYYKAFMEYVYGVDFAIIPHFKEKKLAVFPTIIVDNKETTALDAIIEVVKDIAGRDKRAILVLLTTISEVKTVFKELKNSGYDEDKIFKYGDGESQEAVERELQTGDVIISTNLAGRGTDIQLSKEVLQNGGLHVLTIGVPTSKRMKDQGDGRSARSGQMGSVQLLIDSSKYLDQCEMPASSGDCSEDDVENLDACLFESEILTVDKVQAFVKCIEEERDKDEEYALKVNELCQVPYMLLEGEIFDRRVELARKLDLPLGYEVVVTYDRAPETYEQDKIYLYAVSRKSWSLFSSNKEKDVYIAVLHNGSKKVLDITKDLVEIDYKTFLHIKSILSHPGNHLSNNDLELVYFIAANAGYGANKNVMSRVAQNYESEALNGFSGTTILGHEMPGEILSAHSKMHETGYLKNLISQARGMAVNETKITQDDIQIGRTRELYRLWVKDRSVYNAKYELMQLQEKFGLWLRDQDALTKHGGSCEIENPKKINATLQTKTKQLHKKFDEFEGHIYGLVKSNKLMQNPAYLLRKAFDRQAIYNQQMDKHTVESSGWSDGISEAMLATTKLPTSADQIELRLSYDFQTKEPRCSEGLVVSILSAAGALYNQAYQSTVGSFYDLAPESKAVFIQNPLQDAIDFIQRAIDLESTYQWQARNVMAFMKLYKEGRSIRCETQATDAARVKQDFYDSSAAALHNLYQVIIPKEEAKLYFLLSQNLTTINSDLAQQHLYSIKICKELVLQIEININTTRDAGQRMIRPGKIISLYDLKVNITNQDAVDAIKKSGMGGNNTDDEIIAIFTINNNTITNFNSAQFGGILDELALSGAIIFDLETYKLEEEEKDWLDTVFAAAFGIFQIVIGIALIGTGPFGTLLGQSLVFQGVGDLVNVAYAVYKGRPINLEQYIKSKAMSLAVSVAVASIGSIANSFGWIGSIANPLEKLSTAAFITTAFATNIAIGLATTAISKQIGKDYESEDTEEEVDEEIEELLSRYEAHLRKIFATDAFLSKLSGYEAHKFENELMLEASKIMARYSSRKFRSTGETFARGVVTGAASYLMGGYVAGTAIDAGLGIIKASEAVDYFGSRFGDVANDVSSRGMGSSAMMEQRLENSFTNLGADIMRVLANNGFVVGEDIKYSECGAIQSFDLGNLNVKRRGIENICVEVAGFMQAFQQEKAHFRLLLKDNVVRQVDGIIKHEVIPAFSGLIANVAVDITEIDKRAANAVLGAGNFIKNKLFPGHDAQIAEQRTAGYTAVQEGGPPIKKPETEPKAKTAAKSTSKSSENKYTKAKDVINNLEGPSSFEKKQAHEQLDRVIKATENLSAEQREKLVQELNKRHEANSLFNKFLDSIMPQAHASNPVAAVEGAAAAVEFCLGNPNCLKAMVALPIGNTLQAKVVPIQNALNKPQPKAKVSEQLAGGQETEGLPAYKRHDGIASKIMADFMNGEMGNVYYPDYALPLSADPEICKEFAGKLGPLSKKIQLGFLTDEEARYGKEVAKDLYHKTGAASRYSKFASDILNDKKGAGKFTNLYFRDEAARQGKTDQEINRMMSELPILLAHAEAELMANNQGHNSAHRDRADYHREIFQDRYGLKGIAFGAAFPEHFMGTGSWMDIAGYDKTPNVNLMDGAAAVIKGDVVNGVSARDAAISLASTCWNNKGACLDFAQQVVETHLKD